MPQFSDKSAAALATAHPMLQRLMNSAIAESNFTVLVGHCGQAAQTEAYEKGASKLQWPNSKHNSQPSLAVDIAPYPINWKNIDRFRALSEIIFKHWDQIPVAERNGWKLVWGGDWRSFRDYPHWELRK